MTARIHARRMGFVALAFIGAIIWAPHSGAQSVAAGETARSVRRMLERLPYYGVFDFIVFRIDRGTVYLAGYSYEGKLRQMRKWR